VLLAANEPAGLEVSARCRVIVGHGGMSHPDAYRAEVAQSPSQRRRSQPRCSGMGEPQHIAGGRVRDGEGGAAGAVLPDAHVAFAVTHEDQLPLHVAGVEQKLVRRGPPAFSDQIQQLRQVSSLHH